MWHVILLNIPKCTPRHLLLLWNKALLGHKKDFDKPQSVKEAAFIRYSRCLSFFSSKCIIVSLSVSSVDVIFSLFLSGLLYHSLCVLYSFSHLRSSQLVLLSLNSEQLKKGQIFYYYSYKSLKGSSHHLSSCSVCRGCEVWNQSLLYTWWRALSFTWL